MRFHVGLEGISISVLSALWLQQGRQRLCDRIPQLIWRCEQQGRHRWVDFLNTLYTDLQQASTKDLRCGLVQYRRWVDEIARRIG